MCFSAQASFISAALLSLIGILSIAKSRTTAMRLLASSTLLFGIQQSLEGIVWLTLINEYHVGWIQQLAGLGFIFFALVVWPVCIPILLYYIEKQAYRKKILFFLIGAGIISAACSCAGIYLYGINPHIVNHHIAYSVINLEDTGYSIIYMTNAMLYVLAVVGSLLVSSIAYMWMIGIIVAIGLGVSIGSFWQAFGSVWCFFGALASILVYFAIQQEQKSRSH